MWTAATWVGVARAGVGVERESRHPQWLPEDHSGPAATGQQQGAAARTSHAQVGGAVTALYAASCASAWGERCGRWPVGPPARRCALRRRQWQAAHRRADRDGDRRRDELMEASPRGERGHRRSSTRVPQPPGALRLHPAAAPPAPRHAPSARAAAPASAAPAPPPPTPRARNSGGAFDQGLARPFPTMRRVRNMAGSGRPGSRGRQYKAMRSPSVH